MMFVGPPDHCLHRRQERTPEIGQRIFDTRRHFCVQRATDEAVLLEPLERARQHLVRHIADRTAEFVETHRPAGQRFEYEQAPLVADAIEHIADRARDGYGGRVPASSVAQITVRLLEGTRNPFVT